MNITLSSPVYIRKSPSNGEYPLGWMDQSSVINVSNIVVGNPIDGNGIWYQDQSNRYFWSGAVDDMDFRFPGADINGLSRQQKMIVLAEVIEYCWIRYRHVKGLTGIFIGEKYTDSNIITDASLVFQVEEKRNVSGDEKIPSEIVFKGFCIPTDVVSVQIANFEARPGDTCSRIKVLDVWGSVGVKVKRREGERDFFFFLTNYHVAASSLIANGIFSYNPGEALDDRQMMVPSQSAAPTAVDFVGALHEGHLSSLNDIALVMLRDPASFTNSLPTGDELQGHLDIFNKSEFVGATATICGAKSGVQRSRIRSVNSTQKFDVPGGVHEMKKLIQIERFSEAGDSGSAVLIGNKIIGLHVGSDDQFSYAIPVSRILNSFQLEIA
jgi:hypothetical protein